MVDVGRYSILGAYGCIIYKCYTYLWTNSKGLDSKLTEAVKKKELAVKTNLLFLVGAPSMWNIRREDWRRLTNPFQGGGAIPWDGEQLFSSTFGFYGWDILKMEVPGRFVRFISAIILGISDKGESTRKCAKVLWYVWKRWMNNQLRFTNCFTWLHLVCLRKAFYLKTFVCLV